MSARATVHVDTGNMSVADYARYVASQAPPLPRAQRHHLAKMLRSNTWDASAPSPATSRRITA